MEMGPTEMNTATKCSKLVDGGDIWQVSLKKLTKHKDHRGSFSEIFRDEWGTVIEPVQWSFVESGGNVLRGMHFHRRHDEFFCLLKGHCIVALKDIRSGSPSENVHSVFELFGDDFAALAFPWGIIHGWYFFEPSMHVQAVSESYTNYGTDDNWGVSWRAPDLGVTWPDINPVLSERAEGFSSVEKLKASIPGGP
jgi:dTDP-4-dehydrorhamnose 3,5-epimerase